MFSLENAFSFAREGQEQPTFNLWAYFNLTGTVFFNLEILEKIKNQLLLLW